MEVAICTLNCRGLRDRIKRKKVFKWLEDNHYDIILLQETHSMEQDEKSWENEWGGKVYFSHGARDSRGVMVMFRPKCDIDVISVNTGVVGGRVLYVFITMHKTKILLVNIYAPNEDSPEFFKQVFDEVILSEADHLLIAGDYNLVLDVDMDKQGGRAKTNEKAQRCILEYMENIDLMDIWRIKNPEQNEYTWRRKKPHVVQCRLDFFLISPGLANLVKHVSIGNSFMSDHSVVKLVLKMEEYAKGPGYWKFNCSLLKDKDYIDMVKETIKQCDSLYSDSGIDELLLWETMKMEIRGATIKYSARKKRQERILVSEYETKIKEIEQKGKLSDEEMQELENCKLLLNEIYDKKVAGEIVRCRVREYEEGEKSSSYFLSLEKNNQAKKTIYQLKTEKGMVVTSREGICKEIVSFYSALYDNKESDYGAGIELDFFSKVQCALSDEKRVSCEGLITRNELLTALKQTPNNKSPGIDGIPSDFYKVFWNDIAQYLVNALNRAFQLGELSVNHRRGIISLIPKKGKDSAFLKNWRPITLLCCDYKLVSKAIANRIKVHLADLVHTDQNGFIKDRYIGQNIDLLYQIIEHTENNHTPGIIFTADFEKAFDKLSWRFIDRVLKKYNFGEMLIKWVKLFYTNVNAVVNVNGFFTDTIILKRGVKQGDPLSTYLFILCVELLAINIRCNNNIQGIVIGGTEHKLSLFADDTNMFIHYCEESLNNVLKTLENFSIISGLKINFEKSIAYCIGVKQNQTLNTIIPITWSYEMVGTLGIQIPLENRKDIYKVNYEAKISSMEATIKAWSMRSLSLRGKVTVIKSLLMSKFQYLITTLGIPDKSLIVRINKAVYKFLWKGSEKLKRKVMINSREEGGLNVPDFESVCKTAMIKWVHRYLHSAESNWKEIVSYSLRQLGGKFLFQCNLNKKDKVLEKIKSSLWKDIVTCWCEFNYKKELNPNQDAIVWLNSDTTEILYNKECISNGLLHVNQFYENGHFMSINNLCDKYNVTLNIMEYCNIKQVLSCYVSNEVTEGTIETVTNLQKRLKETILGKPVDKTLSKRIYGYLISQVALCGNVQTKWAHIVVIEDSTNDLFASIEKLTISNKLRSFQYRFLHRILYFNDKLFKCKLATTTMCDFCNDSLDSIEHRYFYCRVTQGFWTDVQNWLKCNYKTDHVLNDIKLIVTNICLEASIVEIVVLNAKYFIFLCFLNKCEPSLQAFKRIIQQTESTERSIATHRSLLHIHKKRWNIND